MVIIYILNLVYCLRKCNQLLLLVRLLYINTYLNDSATANKQYTGKVIEVYGSVGTIDTSNSNIAINMKTDTISNGVISCSMEKGTNMLKEMQGVKLGDSIRVKGLCTGYIDFASQVNINEGFIVK